MKTLELDTFTRAYVEAALWSSTDDDENPLDQHEGEIAEDTLRQMADDCADFQKSFGDYIAGREKQAGHDFWLTRNGHGAGFWDGDWKGEYTQLAPEHAAVGMVPQYRTVGDYLTAMSKPYGSYVLYVGDDGQIYGQ